MKYFILLQLMLKNSNKNNDNKQLIHLKEH